MKNKFKSRNKNDNNPAYRSYSNRNHSYSLSHDKFVVPWQLEEKKVAK
ncbi:hypothetical protein [Mariniphaga sp.]